MINKNRLHNKPNNKMAESKNYFLWEYQDVLDNICSSPVHIETGIVEDFPAHRKMILVPLTNLKFQRKMQIFFESNTW